MRHDPDNLEGRDPALMDRMADAIRRFFVPYHRYQCRGLERVPDGAALYVGNHNAAMLAPEAFLFSLALYDEFGMDAVPYGLAHEVAMRSPLGAWLNRLGGVRACHENAHRIFARGAKTIVFPGGDLDANRPWSRRHEIEMDGRTGYVRLALSAGVPIVPFVTIGAHETLVIMADNRWLAKLIGAPRWMRMKAWPLAFSIPWGVTLGPIPPHFPMPSKITCEVLPPMHFDRSGPEAASDDAYVRGCADEVERAMQACMDRLAAR